MSGMVSHLSTVRRYMKNIPIKKTKKAHQYEGGIALLITLLLMGVLLGIGTALLNVTLKQYQLSGVTFQSEIAFQAANAAMECALYNHYTTGDDGVFYDAAISGTRIVTLNCFEESEADMLATALTSESPNNEQRFQFTWGTNPQVCSGFSAYIFHLPDNNDGDLDDLPVLVDGEQLRQNDCREGSTCAVFKARGYNVPCDSIDDGGARVVEREFTLVY